jgi:putative drug exporter of the RND superfamily
MFKAIAKFSVKFRWLIIIFWIAAVPIVTANFPNINDVSKNNTSDFLPKNSPTDTASKLETAFQHKDTATNSVIVASRGGARLSDSDNAALRRAVANVQKVKEITEVRDLGASADGQAHEYIVGISGAGFGQGATDIVANIRTALHKSNLPSGLKTNLTGDLAAGVDQENANSKGRNSTEIYSVIMILALLLLVFRSILAPIVTLLPAGLALAIAQPVIAESTKAGVQVGFITQILLIVLLLGAGTDYGLFLVFRVREEMRGKGLNSKDAVVEALSHVGESITFSAATVIAALLSLTLATFGLYKGLGPALAIGLVLMLLISLTFLPALLSILGRAVFWPSKTSKREAKFGLWGRLADRVIKKPILMLVVGAVLFPRLGRL